MKRFFYAILIAAMFLPSLLIAQQEKKEMRNPKLQFDLEAFKAERQAFFVAELELTPDEAMDFLPLSEEYQNKMFKIGAEKRAAFRSLMHKEDQKEEDYEEILKKGIEIRQKEVDLEREYLEKFKAVISSKKLFKYKEVERKFIERYINRRQEKHRKWELHDGNKNQDDDKNQTNVKSEERKRE